MPESCRRKPAGKEQHHERPPYVTHPVSVATILTGLGADDQTLCAAILHDTVEDTPYTLTAMSRTRGQLDGHGLLRRPRAHQRIIVALDIERSIA